jgi:single-strand DNA-binding protein
MNKVILLGNLTADPEVKEYNGNCFTVFTIAVSDGSGDKKKTYFFDCISNGKTGENIAKYFEQGKPICAEGKLYTKKNDETGYEENKISIYGFTFINGADGGKGKGKGKGKSSSKPKQEKTDDVDDIPF